MDAILSGLVPLSCFQRAEELALTEFLEANPESRG